MTSLLSDPTDGEGTLTPGQAQVVTMVPWRVGNTPGETQNSFIFVRLQAFISKAFFRTPVQVLAVGDPVVGYVEPTNGDSRSAQIVSWGPVGLVTSEIHFVICDGSHSPDLEFWARTSPVTLPNHFEVHTDAIYPLPQLHSHNFDYLRVPHLNVGVFSAPHLQSVLTIPKNPSPLLGTQLASQFLAQDQLFGVDLASPVPVFRGRSPGRTPGVDELRAHSAARRTRSAEMTPGAGPSQVGPHLRPKERRGLLFFSPPSHLILYI